MRENWLVEGRELGNRALSWTEKRNKGLIRKGVTLFVYLIKRKISEGTLLVQGSTEAAHKKKSECQVRAGGYLSRVA